MAMAVLDVKLYPEDPLTQKATPFAVVGDDVQQLAADMLETMEAYDGVGLAGPQVGVAKRIFVLREPEGAPMCLINPEILERDGSEMGEEGCLSIPQIYTDVPRATRIRVKALNERGEPVEFEAHDFLARVIQHENDHLDGLVIFDRVDVLTREALLREWEDIRRQLLAARR